MTEFKFANMHGYSDIEPYEIVRWVGKKTIEIREMKYEADPSFKPEWIVGGYAGHCTNAHGQKWFISSDETAPIIRARLNKDGYYRSKFGKHILNDEAIRFYDYNF